jgi:hypothetical protein
MSGTIFHKAQIKHYKTCMTDSQLIANLRAYIQSVSKAEGLDSTSDANSPDEGFHDTCKDSSNMSE